MPVVIKAIAQELTELSGGEISSCPLAYAFQRGIRCVQKVSNESRSVQC